MITSVAFVLLGAAVTAATPCENLASLRLADTTITSAVVVPEGPPPARTGARGGGAAPANIPAHCRVQIVLKPTSDSLINMELWLPTENWNGKFMGVGNGGISGPHPGLNNKISQRRGPGYATARSRPPPPRQKRKEGQPHARKKTGFRVVGTQ